MTFSKQDLSTILFRDMEVDEGPILVVDDDGDQLHIIERCYELSGRTNKLVLLHSGEDFTDFMAQVDTGNEAMPSLVLLDINMPIIDGFDVLQVIRQREKFREIPVIIMLTASNAKADRTRSKELGASGFWTKPTSIGEYVEFFRAV